MIRWSAKDPVLFFGGETVLYSYGAGDPIGNLDPTGLAQLCTRPLDSAGGVASAVYPGDSRRLDELNREPLHEHFWLDDGSNSGLFPQGVRPDFGHTRDDYTCKGDKLYDDDTLREAIQHLTPRAGKYDLWFGNQNNCQDWVERVRREYERLRQEKIDSTGEDPEVEYIWQRVLNR